jgi:hypothetical protein
MGENQVSEEVTANPFCGESWSLADSGFFVFRLRPADASARTVTGPAAPEPEFRLTRTRKIKPCAGAVCKTGWIVIRLK